MSDESSRAGGGRTRLAHRPRIGRVRLPRPVVVKTPPAPPEPSLFTIPAFRAYWLARFLTQTAQGALLYGLLVILVDETNSSFYNTLFVQCALIPALLFGLPAGVVVDAVPRRPLLVVLNATRFLFAVSLLSRTEPTLVPIFATTLGIWTIQQFYAPAESATLASIVPPHRLVSAQALANLALSLSQVIGFTIGAPLLLKLLGPHALFAYCAFVFAAGAFVTGLLPKVEIDEEHRRRRVPPKDALLTGWNVARRDPRIYDVMVVDILIGIGLSALIVITPFYLKGVLNTPAENTVFVFAPAALGLVIGLRMAPIITPQIGAQTASITGLVVFALCIAFLGVLQPVNHLLVDILGLPVDDFAGLLGLQGLTLMVMVVSIPAGFASAIVGVAARSFMIHNTPLAARGQVIATQNLLQNVGAIIPTLLAGIATDLVGVEVVALAIASSMIASMVLALTRYRPLDPAVAAPV